MKELEKILGDLKTGKTDIASVLEFIKELPFQNLEFAHVDHHRELRQGFPEVVFCAGKTVEQIERIVGSIMKRKSPLLATRAGEDIYIRLHKKFASLQYNKAGRIVYSEPQEQYDPTKYKLVLVTAGTADIAVAEEAYQTAYALGFTAQKIYDVGVAGIHRLLHYRQAIASADVVIVAAGMEGALPSVVGGITSAPLIAVPTSAGYGTSFGGITALFAMLNSCASGVSVVNIDNGFGAAYAAARYLRRLNQNL